METLQAPGITAPWPAVPKLHPAAGLFETAARKQGLIGRSSTLDTRHSNDQDCILPGYSCDTLPAVWQCDTDGLHAAPAADTYNGAPRRDSDPGQCDDDMEVMLNMDIGEDIELMARLERELQISIEQSDWERISKQLCPDTGDITTMRQIKAALLGKHVSPPSKTSPSKAKKLDMVQSSSPGKLRQYTNVNACLLGPSLQDRVPAAEHLRLLGSVLCQALGRQVWEDGRSKLLYASMALADVSRNCLIDRPLLVRNKQKLQWQLIFPSHPLKALVEWSLEIDEAVRGQQLRYVEAVLCPPLGLGLWGLRALCSTFTPRGPASARTYRALSPRLHSQQGTSCKMRWNNCFPSHPVWGHSMDEDDFLRLYPHPFNKLSAQQHVAVSMALGTTISSTHRSDVRHGFVRISYDDRSVDLPVVIKRCNKEFAHEGVAEAVMLARLRGWPGSVQMYGYSLSPCGSIDMVLEPCKYSLAGWAEAARQPGAAWIARVLKVFHQVACDLSHCHTTLGVAHLDIKPHNILMSAAAAAAGDQPKLADWAEARMGLSAPAGSATKATLHLCEARGTEAYQCPEMHTASTQQPVDAYAADVWALGASLYEVITGDILFPGKCDNLRPTTQVKGCWLTDKQLGLLQAVCGSKAAVQVVWSLLSCTCCRQSQRITAARLAEKINSALKQL